MWKPIDLRFDYNLLLAGKLKNTSIQDLKKMVTTHQKEFVKVKAHMPGTLMGECIESLNALDEFYKMRLSKEAAAKKSVVKKSPAQQRLTPTQVYKQKFGSLPTEDYRSAFGSFDKASYSRWLLAQVREGKAE